jgi:hypothetical protein
MTTPAPARDRGAALIIAIGFVVMIGAIAAGLTAMVTSGVGNRAALEQIRDRQYAADGAVEDAVAETRVLLDVGKFTCGDASAGSTRMNDVDVRVELVVTCTAVLGDDGFPVVQMSGAFVACEDRRTACEAADVVVRTLVAFETDAGGRVVGTSVRSWSVLR